MSQIKANPIPLPCAVLALSVAVCIGSAGAADATVLRSSAAAHSQQRETLEHLLEALHKAADDLNHRLDSAAVADERRLLRPVLALQPIACAPSQTHASAIPPLREALLNLPPPTR